MKIDCPHCKKKGIGYFAKWWSGSTTPARCNLCDNLSYVTDSTRYYSTPTVVAVISYAIGIISFLFIQKLFLLLLLPLGYLLSQLYLVLYSPMDKSTKKQISHNKRIGNFLLLLIFSGLLVYAIVNFVT